MLFKKVCSEGTKLQQQKNFLEKKQVRLFFNENKALEF